MSTEKTYTPSVRKQALSVLEQVERGEQFSNLAVQHVANEVEEKDRPLFTELVYGTLSHKRYIDYQLEPFVKKQRIKLWIRWLLRMTVYQMLFLDRVPDRAAIHEAVQIAKKRTHPKVAGLVNAVLRNVSRQGIRAVEGVSDAERLAIETSHETWLVEAWIEAYGLEDVERLCYANNEPPEQTARVNLLQTTRDSLIKELEESGYAVNESELLDEAIVNTKGNLAFAPQYERGLFTIQDEASMLVARALDPQPNERILDACAAPGGKTTHIAERMGDTGEIVALDVHPHKKQLIESLTSRLQLSSIEVKTADATNLDGVVEGSFDRVLVDAPCSGFGVIRRKPEVKYTKTSQDVESISQLQRKIVESVLPYIKSGGTLVYSTCTMMPKENEQVVEQLLLDHPELSIDISWQERLPAKLQTYVRNGTITILPHYAETDGFFIACLKKK
ncbi:16S rRNA (cytosine(967)-C(5))-methyltransferase RsmB [Bacillus fonticola]|uniref:16S rRNA (cytosine(967)-C(5))-methyltransferase RsmB n=1 Tax=Bacillus fonticola TaxID=2728853 RepID=UPI0014761E00|nr:16S rRNA (cytosine(967)-C(5))-methyltransferase RsmB [Bacillus fonticola]